MRAEAADELERFVLDGGVWDPARVTAMITWLDAETLATGDPIPAQLARPLGSVGYRLRLGPVAKRTADDVEAVIYPRLWKVLEAIRDELPDSEIRVRIEVLNRRLARTFAEEAERDAARNRAEHTAPPADRPQADLLATPPEETTP